MSRQKLTPAQIRPWRAFLTAHAQVVKRIDAELVRQGAVPLEWYDVLLALKEAPEERLRLSDLARKVLLSRSGLTRLLDRLGQAGLIVRESAPEDGRGVYAILRPEGTAALRKAWPLYAAGISQHFLQHIRLNESPAIRAALERIVEATAEE